LKSALAPLLAALLATACGPNRVVVVARTRASLDGTWAGECERVCASALRDGEKVMRCSHAELVGNVKARFPDLHEYAVTCELE
jgi:hypothetical protein